MWATWARCSFYPDTGTHIDRPIHIPNRFEQSNLPRWQIAQHVPRSDDLGSDGVVGELLGHPGCLRRRRGSRFVDHSCWSPTRTLWLRCGEPGWQGWTTKRDRFKICSTMARPLKTCLVFTLTGIVSYSRSFCSESRGQHNMSVYTEFTYHRSNHCH